MSEERLAVLHQVFDLPNILFDILEPFVNPGYRRLIALDLRGKGLDSGFVPGHVLAQDRRRADSSNTHRAYRYRRAYPPEFIYGHTFGLHARSPLKVGGGRPP